MAGNLAAIGRAGLMDTVSKGMGMAKAIRDMPREEETWQMEKQKTGLQIEGMRQQQAIGAETLAAMKKKQEWEEGEIDVSGISDQMGIDPEGQKMIGGFLQMEGGYNPETQRGPRGRLLKAFENFWKTPQGKNFSSMQYVRWRDIHKDLKSKYEEQYKKTPFDSEKLGKMSKDVQRSEALSHMYGSVNKHVQDAEEGNKWLQENVEGTNEPFTYPSSSSDKTEETQE